MLLKCCQETDETDEEQIKELSYRLLTASASSERAVKRSSQLVREANIPGLHVLLNTV